MYTDIQSVIPVMREFIKLPVICNHIGCAYSIHLNRYNCITLYMEMATSRPLYEAIMNCELLDEKRKEWVGHYPEILFNFNGVDFTVVCS